MKKILFMVIALTGVIAMTSCGNKKQTATSEEIPIEGTPYTLTQASNGKFGLKKNGMQVIDEKYDSLSYFHGCFIGTALISDGYSFTSLITPDGREGISGKDFKYVKEGNYFIKTDEPAALFFADTGKGFGALTKYVVADNVVLIKRQKLSAYTTASDTLLVENPDYQKLVYLKKDKKFLVQIEGHWFKTAGDTDDFKQLSPTELRKYKKSTGWKNEELFALD